ncbi:DNA methylase [Novosphingobium fuchskuhlense]|uniref:site-specific DNA-methyltransferase (adenine-specific) n=1 Tax=Novosphingobium fuchskuhlense TaxID=1117702 RepID=A0A117UXH0_9SPHN|nr:site-specific DNA-methyltransferase [Novosphingobium fuchskuhlense]KUR72642.1 DNA methylase [Novosphingobium fuchskuhlense]
MSKDNPEAFETFEFDLPPIRGFPELRWAGKRPFKSTQYFPAQKKESYGDPTDGWWNRLYWGDNLQVMSHLLREFRGQVDLVYIDPPFDSKADYKKKIKLKSGKYTNDSSVFEEKQYEDIWVSDSYFQFMYERLQLIKELCSDHASIFVHIDPGTSHYIKAIMDEIFGPDNFLNEIIWSYRRWPSISKKFQSMHDVILYYSKSKSDERRFEVSYEDASESYMKRFGGKTQILDESTGTRKITSDEDTKGMPQRDVWDISVLAGNKPERVGYPTQKPEELIARIVNSASKPGDLVFDCFMGSGTTQSVAMQLGRRFIGADINLGSIETASKRLIGVNKIINAGEADLLEGLAEKPQKFFTGFELYNVNNYDLFRNPSDAKNLITEAMELQPLPPSSAFDGQREGYLVKIMPVNRIATRQDLNEVINGLDFKAFERRQAEAPNKPVERIHLVCMGHEPDLGPALQKEAKPFDIEVMVTDLIRDKAHLHFKKASDARLAIENGELVIKGFYPMNLLQKLSLESDAVEDWRQLVESVKVDFNYDGAVLTPAIVDAPGKEELVTGRYAIPAEAATIRVKITDLLSESWEGEIENG